MITTCTTEFNMKSFYTLSLLNAFIFSVSFIEEGLSYLLHGIEILHIITEEVCVYCAVRTEFVNVLQVHLRL